MAVFSARPLSAGSPGHYTARALHASLESLSDYRDPDDRRVAQISRTMCTEYPKSKAKVAEIAIPRRPARRVRPSQVAEDDLPHTELRDVQQRKRRNRSRDCKYVLELISAGGFRDRKRRIVSCGFPWTSAWSPPVWQFDCALPQRRIVEAFINADDFRATHVAKPALPRNVGALRARSTSSFGELRV